MLLREFTKHLAPEGSGLLHVDVALFLELVSLCKATHSEGLGCELLVLSWSTVGVGLVVNFRAVVAGDGWETVSLVVGDTTNGAVNGDLFKVGSKSVALGVGVGENSCLKNSIVREFNTGDKVTWGEGNLFNLSKEVFWIFVEYEFSNRNQWIVSMWPYFCDVCDIVSIVLCILFWHHLDIVCPCSRFA